MQVGQYAYVVSLPMCDSGLLTTILIDGATPDSTRAGVVPRPFSSVDATRGRRAPHPPHRVVCIPRDAAQRVPATAYRLPRGYSELAPDAAAAATGGSRLVIHVLRRYLSTRAV